MAGKFWTAAALVSAFISLSGAAAASRRCFWCGPLAEQVHRSRRSSPCGASDHVTVCESGYNYCAVVATSPPRVESRYCVKMYQDECYPLFCNSTKTWKMTCPCRGDLCNGPNTARETEAFARLPKLVAKTHNARIKKRTAIAAPHLIKHDGITKLNTSQKLIVSEDNSNQLSEMQSDQPTNMIVEHHVEENDPINATNENKGQSMTTKNQLIEIDIHVSDPTEGPVKAKENNEPCTEIPSTTAHDLPPNTSKPPTHDGSIIATTTEMESDNTPSKTTEKTDENTTTTETVQQGGAEVTTTDASSKPTSESNAEKMPSIEPDKPVEYVSTTAISIISTLTTEEVDKPGNEDPVDEMQNDVSLIDSVASNQSVNTSSTPSTMISHTTFNIQVEEIEGQEGFEDQMQDDAPIDSAQSATTTATTLIQQTTFKEEVKSTEGLPTAEALQQNGSHIKATEKAIEATTEVVKTTTTVIDTTKNLVAITTPPTPRRKNNTSRIYFNYSLLIICFVYLLL